MARKKKPEPTVARRQTWEIVNDLLEKYGKDRIVEALKNEVLDSKQSEAETINDEGASEQIRYLFEEAYYQEGALTRIIEEFED